MSMFLFHVINLAWREVTPADLLLAIWLPIGFFTWLALGSRTLLLEDRSGANKIRVYRHLWDSLEKLYRELRDGGASDSALRAHFREAYTFFLRNAPVIEAGDRVVFGRYVHTLQCLRFVNRQNGSMIWEGPAQTASSPSIAVIHALVFDGWIAEGYGPNAVAMCFPE